MAHRIEAAFRPGFEDALGRSVRERIRPGLGLPVRDVRTVDVYTLDGEFSIEELHQLARDLFSDPIVQLYSVDEPLTIPWDWLIEVGYKPGSTTTRSRRPR